MDLGAGGRGWRRFGRGWRLFPVLYNFFDGCVTKINTFPDIEKILITIFAASIF
jgi:hypothetical protein